MVAINNSCSNASRLCKQCLRQFRKRSNRDDYRKAKAEGFPRYVCRSGSGRLCDKHQAESNAQAAKRRVAEAQRSGINTPEVKAIYAEAQRLRRSGLKVHVDHVIPLRGKLVSGLHVAANLKIVPASDNIRKGNKFKPFVEWAACPA